MSPNLNAFRKFATREQGQKQAVEANRASDAIRATDGKPRAEGRVRRRSRTCACCAHVLKPAVSRGVERFAEQSVSGPFLTIEFPKGIALHSLGAGIRLATNYGGDQRNTGAAFSGRLRPNGAIVARNSLIAPAQNRTDLRLQQRIPLHGRASIDAIAEVFNIFNRPNFGIGTVENNVQHLQNVTAQTRTMQFGFRLTY